MYNFKSSKLASLLLPLLSVDNDEVVSEGDIDDMDELAATSGTSAGARLRMVTHVRACREVERYVSVYTCKYVGVMHVYVCR